MDSIFSIFFLTKGKGESREGERFYNRRDRKTPKQKTPDIQRTEAGGQKEDNVNEAKLNPTKN